MRMSSHTLTKTLDNCEAILTWLRPEPQGKQLQEQLLAILRIAPSTQDSWRKLSYSIDAMIDGILSEKET